MLPLDLLKQYLLGVEETQLIDLLGLTSEDIVNAFEEKILKRRSYLEKEVEYLPMTDPEPDMDSDNNGIVDY